MADTTAKTRKIRIVRIKKPPIEKKEDLFDNFYQTEDEPGISNDDEFDQEYTLINLNIEPPNGKWKLPPLYKIGARGEDRYYQIGFDGENVVTKHGQVGGEIQTSRNKVELNTSGRDVSQQAMIKASNLFRKNYRKNYREQGSSVMVVSQPMCGHPLKDAKNLTFPVALELKLNGVRGMFEMNEFGKVQVRSRGNKLYTQFDHICMYMQDLFMYFTPGTILDGEIYKHGMLLEDISGSARTINIKAELAVQLVANIFDAVLPDNPYYEDRKAYIKSAYDRYLIDNDYKEGDVPITILPYTVVNTMEEIYDFHKEARDNGYEGTIIKRMAAGTANKAMCQYKGGKSGRFFKLKDVFDEEGIILEVLDCTGKESGCARFKLVDPRGNIFTIRPKGSYEYRQELFQQGEELIGQLYTYEYSGLTKYEVPEHPRGVAVRYDLDTDAVVEDMIEDISAKGICICEYIGGECSVCRKE